jgi:hypothetical protein
MFKTARDLLNLSERKVVWLNQNPTIFTTKVAALDPAIAALEEYCRKHGVDLTGIAKDKDLEETDVEDVGHKLGRLMLDYSRDQGDNTTAAKCDLSLSAWRGLRDTALILKAREIRDLALPVAATPLGFSYGITSSLVQQLTTEVNEYEEVVNQPTLSISQRKILTLGLRAEFNKVEARFESLDDLILAFNTTPAGRDLIAAFKEARIIRDAGHGPKEPPAPPTPPSA